MAFRKCVASDVHLLLENDTGFHEDRASSNKKTYEFEELHRRQSLLKRLRALLSSTTLNDHVSHAYNRMDLTKAG